MGSGRASWERAERLATSTAAPSWRVREFGDGVGYGVAARLVRGGKNPRGRRRPRNWISSSSTSPSSVTGVARLAARVDIGVGSGRAEATEGVGALPCEGATAFVWRRGSTVAARRVTTGGAGAALRGWRY